jgi:hypothetical protein
MLAAPAGDLVEAVEARGLARLLGLALLPAPPREALWLPRCRSVHTFGMRFSLDVVFLAPEDDGALRALAVETGVGPGRVVSWRGGRGAGALELAAGEAARLRLWPGLRLRVLARRGANR